MQARESIAWLSDTLRLHFSGAQDTHFVFHNRDITGMLYMNCALWLIVQNGEHSVPCLCLCSLSSQTSEPFISMLWAEGKADSPSQSRACIHIQSCTCWYINAARSKLHKPRGVLLWGSLCTSLQDLMKSNAPLLSVHRRADRCLVTCVGMCRFRHSIVLSLIGFQGGVAMCVSSYDDIIGTECKTDCYVQMYVVLSSFMLWTCMLCCTLNGRLFHAQPFFFRCKSPLLVPEVWNREFKCSAEKGYRAGTFHKVVEKEAGSSRRLVMFWPQCKSISAIWLMNWSMIYTVSGARFLPPPLAKCWQRLSVYGRPFVLLWVSWFVLFILNPRSSLVVSW